MLVNMKEMLQDAKRNHYAIPAFDISNYEIMRTVLETCEENRSPALLMALGVDLEGRNMQLLASMVKSASDYFKIPVCFHVDHATSFEHIKRAIDSGFSSVMFDGSILPFDKNATATAEIVKYAHSKGITVEAELGHVSNGDVGNVSETGDVEEDHEETLTIPEEVRKFVGITDVDALAIAIGTAHGVYKKTPSLKIDRLREIASLTDIPLVLHGGSGTPYDQLKDAINNGITKINIYSDVLYAFNKGLKESLNTMTNPTTWPFITYASSIKYMKEVITDKIHTFGSANRV